MLKKIKVFAYSAILFIMIFYPVLEIKAEDSFKFKYETGRKEASLIGYKDTRPTLKINKSEHSEQEIAEKIKEIEVIAQLVMAEAGTQDLTGKRYVVDVVLNRVDSNEFPNTVEEVIFQDNQFSVIKNGAFDKAISIITEDCYKAVKLEYDERLNYDILYFSRKPSKYASNHFKYQDHWFGW